MRRVRSANTRPELAVRKLLTSLGHRYRLHRRDIQGNPDIAFIGRRKLIFVHGCFWHGHSCKRGARVPKTNRQYWQQKIARNMERDRANKILLKQAGWSVLIIWECETGNPELLTRKLKRFLRDTSP